MMRYLLGIDVGTTGTKALLIGEDGKIVGQAYCPYPTSHPGISRSEQDPEDWWNSVCQTVRNVTDDSKIRKNISALSLSTQGGTMVGLDKAGKPIRPAMVWNDRRCTEESQVFHNEMPQLDVYPICGWRVTASMPMLQCRWLKKHEPENFAKIEKYLSVPDYLAFKMTGIAAVDISNAGICRFANIQTGTYHAGLLSYAGLTEEKMAKILPSSTPIGRLTKQAALCLNLPETVTVVSGAHDQYAVALGAGACSDGDVLIGSGTSWVVTSISENPDFASGLSQSVSAVPGKWGSLWSLSSGGVCMEWLRNNITASADGTLLSYHVINGEVVNRKAAEDGLFFYPFAGRATDDALFQKGSFVGLDLSHDRFHIARAIMEGVAFQIAWTIGKLRVKPSQSGIIFAGGGSKSRAWCEILANVLNLPVRIHETADLACVGAAIMAGVGCGLYQNEETACRCMAVAEQVIQPEPEKAIQYRQLLTQYQNYGAALGSLYQL